MDRNEIVSMLEDMDSLGWFVNDYMAVPSAKDEKAEAAEKIQSVKYGLVKLLDEYDKNNKTGSWRLAHDVYLRMDQETQGRETGYGAEVRDDQQPAQESQYCCYALAGDHQG